MPKQRSSRYHHGDLHHALLDAAETLLQSVGIDQLSLRAIARTAGVSHAAPYHHFADLEDLLAGVAATGFDRLREAMTGSPATTDSPALNRLQDAGIGYVRFAAEHPELYRLMFSGRLRRSTNPELARASSGAYATLGELLSGTRSNSAGKAENGNEAAARAAWATVHGLAMLIIDDRLKIDRHDGKAVENVAREVTNVLGRGLKES